MAGATVTMILGQKSCPAPTLVVTHSRDDLHAFSRFGGMGGPSVPQQHKYIRAWYGPDPSSEPSTGHQPASCPWGSTLESKQTRPPGLAYIANNHTTAFASWRYSIKRNDPNVKIDLGPFSQDLVSQLTQLMI
ncbi:hypothetical protein N7489_010602 [Penicillium chrysogenum]|uniref:uncharacterized protein n=1 Tax=Penicillium chrysogenum TaxID=5076 RepID=UPI0023960336|nr:uncharacterized protein N7489_010602 [Penicillium chrysogenum]KAJ5229894.1 hypothetical protein N7489_010602 [Penicillium chrysogenum]KAJ5271570.1 hypothetical protein N7524_004839 [Penicillium chrysogenum]